jgi:hypothetical protein
MEKINNIQKLFFNKNYLESHKIKIQNTRD